MPELLQPLVPKPDNTGTENFYRGFSLLAKQAQDKREMEMRLALAMQQQKHWEADHALDERRVTAYERNEGRVTAAKKAALDASDELQEYRAQAERDYQEWNLGNPKFQSEQPIDYLNNAMKFGNKYATATPETGVPDMVNMALTKANSQKIPIGAVDTKGNPTTELVPIGQVAYHWSNPVTHQDIYGKLVKANLAKEAGYFTKSEDQKDYALIDPSIRPFLKRADEIRAAGGWAGTPSSDKFQFGHKSKITPSLPSDDPTQPIAAHQLDVIDNSQASTIDAAKAVYRDNPSAKAILIQRLQAKGIDPNILDQ